MSQVWQIKGKEVEKKPKKLTVEQTDELSLIVGEGNQLTMKKNFSSKIFIPFEHLLSFAVLNEVIFFQSSKKKNPQFKCTLSFRFSRWVNSKGVAQHSFTLLDPSPEPRIIRHPLNKPRFNWSWGGLIKRHRSPTPADCLEKTSSVVRKHYSQYFPFYSAPYRLHLTPHLTAFYAFFWLWTAHRLGLSPCDGIKILSVTISNHRRMWFRLCLEVILRISFIFWS